MDNRDIRRKVENLIVFLSSAIQMSSIYGKDHGLTKDAIDRLYTMLQTVLSDRKEITIGIIGNEIAFEEKPFYETSKKIEKLIRQLKDAKVEKVSF